MHEFNPDAELGSSLRRAVISAFLLSSILLLILAIFFLVKDHQKMTALATVVASGLFFFMVVGIWRPGASGSAGPARVSREGCRLAAGWSDLGIARACDRICACRQRLG
jgi:hypothetical protein